MENKKAKIISMIAIIALVLTVVTATYAYFQAQTGEGSQTDVKITSSTVDTLSFETGSSLAFTADQDTFANGKASLSDTTFAKAILTANNKTNSATNNYNLYLNIADNNFTYTQGTDTPELLLQIVDASNNSITSIDGLEYKTVTDNKNTSISGFDITNKTGLINLFINRAITTTSTKTEEWTIKITFVNYNKDQSGNAGKSFDGQILISKDTFDNYTPNTINTLSATKNGTNLTVNLNVEQGSNEIDKYYYAIEETNGLAILDNTSKVQRLSNRLAVSNLTYVESSSSSHTFTNLNSTKDYKVSAYVIDKKKIRSNTYEYNVSSGTYVYPTISKVETSTTSNSITATVSATKGTNIISKYYYSIDNGSTYIESTSNSYAFSNLNGGSYRIMVKVMDTNGKYSNSYVVSEKIEASQTLANYVISQYNGVQGNNNIYYHDSTLANGAGDNSYRYAGPSDQVNNFVCFGTTESPCQTDNLYRIVGVFEESYHGVSEKQLVKLIKYDYANSNLLGTDGDYEAREAPLDTDNYKGSLSTINTYYWNSNTTNTWSTSLLNKTNLNTNFINNIGTTWANKIATTIWKVGGNTYANITSKTPSVAYQNEITNPDATNSTDNATEYPAKIGLMYVSDYGFAASPSAWTTTLYSYDGSDTNENAIETINWMPMGVREWTISRSADSSHYSGCAFIVQNYSAVNVGNVDNLLVVRPSFSLESSVTYVSGSGSMSDPIIIN